jgi:WD40 repeat protein
VLKAIFSPDGEKILTGSLDKTAKLWITNGQLVKSFQGHKFAVDSIAFAPNSKKVLTSSQDKSANLWDIDGQLLQTFSWQSELSYVRSEGYLILRDKIAFAPDGNSILIAIGESANLWSLDARLLERLQWQHEAPILSVAFAPDGKKLLTGSSDKIVNRWNLDLGNSISLLCDNLRDFAAGSSKPNISYRDLRERARKACENIPPPSQ